MRLKGIDLPEIAGPDGNPRPANSPIFKGATGRVEIEVAQNTETGVYTALVGVTDSRRAGDESTDRDAAFDGALAAYASLEETRLGRPSISVADKLEVAAIRARAEPVGAR